jgi:hypothetical protein
LVKLLYVVGALQIVASVFVLWTTIPVLASMTVFMGMGAVPAFSAIVAGILTGVVTLGVARVLQVTLQIRSELGLAAARP